MTVSSKFSFMQSSLHNRPHFDTIMSDFDKSKLLHNPNKKVDSMTNTHYNKGMGRRF